MLHNFFINFLKENKYLLRIKNKTNFAKSLSKDKIYHKKMSERINSLEKTLIDLEKLKV